MSESRAQAGQGTVTLGLVPCAAMELRALEGCGGELANGLG